MTDGPELHLHDLSIVTMKIAMLSLSENLDYVVGAG